MSKLKTVEDIMNNGLNTNTYQIWRAIAREALKERGDG